MQITCLIDNLTAGGAQRQLCSLAVLLKQRGHEVKVITYFPQNFFLETLQQNNIGYLCIREDSTFKRIRRFRSILRNGSQDVVLAFLRTPSLLAELAAIPNRKWGLVVSERNSYTFQSNPWTNWRRLFHIFADYIIVNSHTNRFLIQKSSPWLRERIITIYNCVNLETFSPSSKKVSPSTSNIRLLSVGKFSAQKNIKGFIDAFALAKKNKPSLNISVDWYGDKVANKYNTKNVYNDAKKQIISLGLDNLFKLHPPSSNIAKIFQESTAFVLPSFFEGLPNVVCEAMTCGLPILMSNVCDSTNLVEDKLNGFLFSPDSVEDMANTLIRFSDLSKTELLSMGQYSRKKALAIFDENKFCESYIEVLEAASCHERIKPQHWIPIIPRSAFRYMK
jgi:glycosyltransferase involved in cell wall biosynthesis